MSGPPNVERLKQDKNVAGLIKALAYQKDAKIRAAAANAIGRISDKRVIVPLAVTATTDTADHVRESAGEALSEVCHNYEMSELLPDLASLDDIAFPSQEQVEIVLDGGESGELALTLLSMVRDSDVFGSISNIYHNCLHIITFRLRESDIDTIDAARRKTESGKCILEKIAQLSPNVTAQGLTHHSYDVRRLVLETLEDLNWQPEKGEADPRYLVYVGKWEECVEIGESAVQPLIDVLCVEGQETPVIIGVVKALGAIGDTRAAVPLVEQMLNWERLYNYNDSYPIVLEIVKTLGTAGDAHAIEPLVGKLDHQEVDMRLAAAEGLVEIYQSSQLDDEQKKIILAQRPVITSERVSERSNSYEHEDYRNLAACGAPHHDLRRHTDTHTDQGIGVDFPL